MSLSRADDADGAAGDRSQPWRTRLRLVLAAVPLAVAVALFAVTGPGSGAAPARAPAPAQDTADAEDTAAVAEVFGGPDVAETVPDHDVDGANADVASADADGAGGSTLPAPPPAPSGHRPVAVRIADPAALSLVATGDRVDVVGMDGSVLAERLEVLQDRSSGAGSVLVLAVPDDAGPALAAAALSREVTVILAAGPAVQQVAP